MTERTHYVYTAYDHEDRVLYVGRTSRLAQRQKEHRYLSAWYPLAVRFSLSGPYTYEAAKRIEGERLNIFRPPYANHAARQTLAAIYRRICNREFAANMDAGMEFSPAIRKASARAKLITGYPGNHQAPLSVSDDDLRRAFAAERRYLASRESAA